MEENQVNLGPIGDYNSNFLEIFAPEIANNQKPKIKKPNNNTSDVVGEDTLETIASSDSSPVIDDKLTTYSIENQFADLLGDSLDTYESLVSGIFGRLINLTASLIKPFAYVHNDPSKDQRITHNRIGLSLAYALPMLCIAGHIYEQKTRFFSDILYPYQEQTVTYINDPNGLDRDLKIWEQRIESFPRPARMESPDQRHGYAKPIVLDEQNYHIHLMNMNELDDY